VITKALFDLPFLAKSKPGTSPLISAWADQVVTNGGTRPTAPTIALRDSVNSSIVSAGLDSKVLTWNLFATEDSSLIAACTPQKPGPASVFWNPVTGGGLDGNRGIAFSGVPNYIDTGFNPTTAYSNDTSSGFILYKYTPFNDNTEGDAGVVDFGANTAFVLIFSQSGASYFEANSVFSGTYASASNASWAGWLSGQRTANNSNSLYKANSGVAHTSINTNTTVETGVRANGNVWLGNIHQLPSTPGNISDGGFSFMAFTLGLTSSEDAALFSIIQAALVSKGGGSV